MPKYMLHTLVGILIFILPSAFIHARPKMPDNREHLEIKQFISNNFEIRNQNWDIHQNVQNGNVYFANSGGLIEFNGITWTKYTLPENQILRSVLVDKNGIIFSGSFEDFGIWQQGENCELVYQSLAENLSIEKNDEIWKIYELNGSIYFQSFTSIYVYDYNTVKVIKAPFTLLFMFQVNEKFIAQIIDNGLYWINNNEFAFIEGSEIFNQKKVHSVLYLNEKKILIATANDGLFIYDGNVFHYVDCEASDFLKLNTCNSSIVVNDSLLVFGSILNGIIFTDHQGNIYNSFNKSNGLNNNSVLSLYMDMDNGLWIGLDQGANYLDISTPFIHYANTSGTLGTIYALHRKNNTLYIGTNHGLFKADIKTVTNNYQFENVRFIPNSQGHVWTIQEFDNQIICGHNEGTFLIRDGALVKISDITGGWTIKPYNEFLIEGCYTGLVLFHRNEKGQWDYRNRLEGFYQPVRYLEADYLGFIWAAHHQKGLYRLELNELLDSVVNIEFFESIDGKDSHLGIFEVNNRVLFTNGENIFTYDYVKREVIPFSSLNIDLGEFKMARKIIHFNRNLYWFITDLKIGLFEISMDFTAEKKSELIQKGQNLAASDIQLLLLEKSLILVPNRECFDTYSLNFDKPESIIDRVSIRKMIFTGKGSIETICPSTEGVAVPWFKNNLSVYFSNPSMFSQHEKSYHYRIPEVDSQWHTTITDNFSYLNLKHGDYTIELKGTIDTEMIHSFPFTIKTPWYFTWYAKLSFSLLALFLIFIIYMIILYELNRQKKIIKMKLKEEKLESELDHKSYELMLTIRYLMHKNEIFLELRKEIDAVKQFSAKYPVKNIRSMEKIITEGLEVQTEDWKNAMSKLKFSQQGFFKKLREKYPELTNNDLRLCSYLRMNFSTKEIARLLNISTRAVEISRYRLRKKMKLAQMVNLTEFLMSESFSGNDESQTD